MSFVMLDWNGVRASLDTTATAVAGLLRDIPDGSVQVPGLDWTVTQLAQHIVTEARRFERFGNGQGDPFPADGVADYNADEIAQIAETDLGKLADMLEADHALFSKHAAAHQADDPYTWFDIKLTWAEAGCVYLGELAVHGLDLSRVLRRKWTIPPADARNVAYGLLPVLPSFVDMTASKGFRGSYELRLRGGEPVHLAFNDGTLRVSPANRKADCKISADPEAFLLVGYGRASQWGFIARGKILASGRKPWLGLRFAKLLRNP